MARDTASGGMTGRASQDKASVSEAQAPRLHLDGAVPAWAVERLAEAWGLQVVMTRWSERTLDERTRTTGWRGGNEGHESMQLIAWQAFGVGFEGKGLRKAVLMVQAAEGDGRTTGQLAHCQAVWVQGQPTRLTAEEAVQAALPELATRGGLPRNARHRVLWWDGDEDGERFLLGKRLGAIEAG